jgi:hypothetical protein
MELSLRKASGPVGPTDPGAEKETTSAATGTMGLRTTGGGSAGGVTSRASEYRRYMLEIPNRSLVDPDVRRSLANLFQSVLDAVDPDTGGDLQLLDLRLNLTADAAAVHEIEQRSRGVGATWREEELDF